MATTQWPQCSECHEAHNPRATKRCRMIARVYRSMAQGQADLRATAHPKRVADDDMARYAANLRRMQ